MRKVSLTCSFWKVEKVLYGILICSPLKKKLSLNVCVSLQNEHCITLEELQLQLSYFIVIPILNTSFLFPPPALLLFRQTPSFLIPTVTTCTAFPPSSTWQPPLTSHSRNDCEYTQTRISV